MAGVINLMVIADFDTNGFMQPRTILWKDGRKFEIDRIKDFLPNYPIKYIGQCFRYTVEIQGKTRQLYFRKTDDQEHSQVGRWFVPMKN